MDTLNEYRKDKRIMNTDTFTKEQIEAKAKEVKREHLREYWKVYRSTHREQINEYKRDWMKKHPGKQQEYIKRYWEKKALQILQQDPANCDRNSEEKAYNE